MNRRKALIAGAATAASLPSMAALAMPETDSQAADSYAQGSTELGILRDGVKAIDNAVATQCSDGNWNCDPYMHGMANGLLFAQSMLKAGTPDYLDATDEWLLEDKREITVEQAMKRLKRCIHENDAMAWGWHCNLAMASVDEGMSHDDAQKAARRFMGWLFQRSDYPEF